jgi:hypothetical protein
MEDGVRIVFVKGKKKRKGGEEGKKKIEEVKKGRCILKE